MDEALFRRRARRYLTQLLGICLGCIAVTVAALAVAEGLGRGAVASFLSSIFHGLAAISTLSLIFFGAAVYEWFRHYKNELLSCDHIREDSLRGNPVLGPISGVLGIKREK